MIMRNRLGLSGAVLLAAVALAGLAEAQGIGLHRTDLLEANLSEPGLRTAQVRVDFDPGAVSIRHRHPGEEIAFVLEGELQYELAGQAPVTLHTGQALLIPARVAHLARNVGSGRASELATYIVARDEPIVTPADEGGGDGKEGGPRP